MGLFDRIASLAPLALAPTPLAALGAGPIAQNLIGELGHRMLSWLDAFAPSTGSSSASWSDQIGQSSGFNPDTSELARGGDVYGIRDLASQVVNQLGGTPTQEGELRRALEDFTRAGMVQVGGLSGSDPQRQMAGVSEALSVAGGPAGGEGVDGVIARVQAGTQSLNAANGA